MKRVQDEVLWCVMFADDVGLVDKNINALKKQIWMLVRGIGEKKIENK